MSSASSTRAAGPRNWAALLQATRDEEVAVTPEARALWLRGKTTDPAPGWNADYVHALQVALEQRDPTRLLAMLDAGIPFSTILLPALAEVIRDAKQGRSNGRAAKLTVRDDELIRERFEWLLGHKRRWFGLLLRARGRWIHVKADARPWVAMASKPATTVGEAQREIAEERAVSVDTIKRSLQRTAPES